MSNKQDEAEGIVKAVAGFTIVTALVIVLAMGVMTTILSGGIDRVERRLEQCK